MRCHADAFNAFKLYYYGAAALRRWNLQICRFFLQFLSLEQCSTAFRFVSQVHSWRANSCSTIIGSPFVKMIFLRQFQRPKAACGTVYSRQGEGDRRKANENVLGMRASLFIRTNWLNAWVSEPLTEPENVKRCLRISVNVLWMINWLLPSDSLTWGSNIFDNFRFLFARWRQFKHSTHASG